MPVDPPEGLAYMGLVEDGSGNVVQPGDTISVHGFLTVWYRDEKCCFPQCWSHTTNTRSMTDAEKNDDEGLVSHSGDLMCTFRSHNGKKTLGYGVFRRSTSVAMEGMERVRSMEWKRPVTGTARWGGAVIRWTFHRYGAALPLPLLLQFRLHFTEDAAEVLEAILRHCRITTTRADGKEAACRAVLHAASLIPAVRPVRHTGWISRYQENTYELASPFPDVATGGDCYSMAIETIRIARAFASSWHPLCKGREMHFGLAIGKVRTFAHAWVMGDTGESTDFVDPTRPPGFFNPARGISLEAALSGERTFERHTLSQIVTRKGHILYEGGYTPYSGAHRRRSQMVEFKEEDWTAELRTMPKSCRLATSTHPCQCHDYKPGDGYIRVQCLPKDYSRLEQVIEGRYEVTHIAECSFVPSPVLTVWLADLASQMDLSPEGHSEESLDLEFA